jgi:hypothetical protein
MLSILSIHSTSHLSGAAPLLLLLLCQKKPGRAAALLLWCPLLTCCSTF